MTRPSADDAALTRRAALMASLHTPWVLRSAVTLRIPDLIAAGATDPDELARRSGCAPEGLRRLLRHLTLLGVLRPAPAGGVELDDLGTVLLRDHPSELTDLLDQSNPLVRRTAKVVPELPWSLRTGSPSWERRFGAPFWADLDAHPEVAAAFVASMAAHARELGRAIAARHDWTGVEHLADVGGGSGEALAGVLRAHRGIRGTLIDLPETVRRSAVPLAEAGVADRVRVVGGSFFDPLPGGADTYLLSLILHDWPDGDCVRILRRCAEAGGHGARVLVAEQVAARTDDAADPLFTSEHDLTMLLLFGGAERTEEEFLRLGRAAGMSLCSVTSVLAEEGLCLLEFVVDGPGR